MTPPLPNSEKSSVAIVDPSIWPKYTRAPTDLRPLHEEVVSILCGWGTPVEVLGRDDAPLDIWIRDWGFVEGTYFRYKPDYAAGLYTESAIETARTRLNQRLQISCRDVPLVLDGGNLVHNGSIAILTEKVVRDNRSLSREEIERTILDLGFDRVIFIPKESYDEIGHSDGMCRFVRQDVLLVNDYPAEMSSFRQELFKTLEKAKLNAEIVPFPWFYRDEKLEAVPSAEGCYMNFLQVAQGIVVPQFNNEADERAAEILRTIQPLPVARVISTALARWGGVLNCATLTF